jgi:hypothetical protein
MLMNVEDMELKLLMNHPIQLDGIGPLVSPTIREVIALGYSEYNRALSSMLFDKSQVSELSGDADSHFHWACFFFYKDPSFQKSFSQGIELLFHSEIELKEEQGEPYLAIVKTGGRIDASNFEQLQTIIRMANKVQTKEEEYTPANDKAKEFIELLKRNKGKKPPKKPVTNFHSLLSGLAWKSNQISILQVFDLTIYQFYDGYYRLENIDHYNGILTGIYTGNIDAKQIKMSDMNWAKIIDY